MHLGVINSAATELQATRPDLAAALTKYAEDKTKEKLEKEEAQAKQEGAVEENEDKETEAQHEEAITLFKDSAAALQAKYPSLAASLIALAESEAKILAEMKEAREASEKDEAQGTKDKK